MLKTLKSKSLVITTESQAAIDTDPDTEFLKINAYDGANLPNMILGAIDYILSGTDPQFGDLYNQIKFNKENEIELQLNELRSALYALAKHDHIDFDNEIYMKDYSAVLLSLSAIISTLEKLPEFKEKNAYFLDFIKLSQKFTNLAFVRYYTEKMLSKVRASLEGIQGVTSSTSASLSVNIPIPLPNSTVNLDLFATGSSYGSTGLSFYTVTKTKGAKAGLTFTLLPAKFSGKLSIERAAAELFYSLEAYMDYLNQVSSPDLNKFQARIQGMKESMQQRENLQKLERGLLALNGMFELYLKMFHALPYSGVYLQWTDITKSQSTDRTKETILSAETAATVTIPLSSLGVTLKASTSLKKYSKDIPWLSMINPDCTLADGYEENDLGISKNYDRSQEIGSLKILHGYLVGYNFVLEQLATKLSPQAKKAYEKKKHENERILAPKKLVGNAGRAEVLKASILTALKLREQDTKSLDSRSMKTISRAIYEQLYRLSLLCEFSKNKRGLRKLIGYGTKDTHTAEAEGRFNNLQASFSAQAPYVGNIGAVAIRKVVEGSPFLQENGKYMTLKFSLPIYSTGIAGMAILREKFKSVFAKASEKKIPFNFDDFKSVALAFGLTQGISQGASAAISAVGAPLGVTAAGSADFTFVYKYVDPLTYTIGMKPLPGQSKLIENKKGHWTLDFIVASSALNAGINTASKVVDLPVTLKLSASMGKLAKRTGSDTFHDMFSKVNALSLGKADQKSKDSTAINSLLNGQSGQLLKLFKHVAKMDSNASFELQELYNQLLFQCQNEAEKQEYTKLFSDFIEACKGITTVDGDETENAVSGEAEVAELTGAAPAKKKDPMNMVQFKKAFALFKTILEKQFTYIFKPYYDRAFGIADKINIPAAQIAE